MSDASGAVVEGDSPYEAPPVRASSLAAAMDEMDREAATESTVEDDEAPAEDPSTDEVEDTDSDTPVEDEADEDEGDEPKASDDKPETYTIVVDGEEFEVTLDDMRNGHMRQADYTRKTQELAQERKELAPIQALATALEQDPEGTLAALAQHYGLDSLTGGPVLDDIAEVDPIEREVAELRAWREQQEATARQEQIAADIESLKTTYSDPDLDAADILQFAIDHSIADLDVAYRAMKFEERQAQVKAQAETEEKRRTQRVEAKRKARIVEGGKGNRAAGSSQAGGSEKMSLREAIAAAMQTSS